MRVLAADPGYERLGIAVIEKDGGKETLIYSDCIQTSSKDPFPGRLLSAGEQFEEVIKKYKPDSFATETLYFNVNQKTAMFVAAVRGVLLFIAKKHNLTVFEYSPQQIKVAVTGYGNSTKKQVAEMVEKLISVEKKIKYDDEYDAIGIGITCLASER